ncbi:hypothetical protein [Coleofasciculus sp.]|uniref:hypothetical protein n=1 Tax=Coleofasciculus sp. TaxID=3100458 RepID=UPI003A11D848
MPLGLVFKEMGQELPTTHLSDPPQIFRQLKLAHFFFNWIAKKADQVDAKYPNFENRPLPSKH